MTQLAEARTPLLDGGHLKLLTFNLQVGIQTSAYHHYLTRSWQHLLPHP
ncbi:MAG: EEP domain-containing protein, partial [Halomonas sp.]|nr:EEP domain-containing protein [Halomonas sp.]